MQRPPVSHEARRRGGDPRPLPRRRRRDPRDQHLQRKPVQPGRVRPRASLVSDQRGCGRAGPASRRRALPPHRRRPLGRGRSRPDEQDRVALSRRQRPRLAQRAVRRARRGLHRRGQGARRRRRGHPDRRDHLRHAQREGRALRDRGALRRDGDATAADDLGDDHGRIGPHAQRADGRSLLLLRAPREPREHRVQLRARREGAPPVRRRRRTHRAAARQRVPECGPPQRPRRIRRHAGVDGDPAPRVGGVRSRESGRRVLRHDPRAHPSDRRCRARTPAARGTRGSPHAASERARAARDWSERFCCSSTSANART